VGADGVDDGGSAALIHPADLLGDRSHSNWRFTQLDNWTG
jgi:hypothetical protein